MAKLTAAEATEKWGRRLKGSGEDIRRGIDRVTEAPGQKAARAADKMLAGVQQSISDGTWQSQVAGVSLEEWKEKAKNKGIGRIAAGVDAAMPKHVQTMERVLAAVDATKAEVDRMPSTTLEDRINRMVAFSRGMSSRKIKRPR